ncbi:MAG: aminoacetone oxidase family FAD-binding enzyme [Clostridia bacterium]|nr:aminoacetone oxidase family FAD-binding enzyme [Clostridia bacterium]
MKTISVIGGGASGFAAAIEAARVSREMNIPVKIRIFERLPKPGKKILATGNGRCNVLNARNDLDNYNGDKKFISSVFSHYDVESNIEFFFSMGICLAEEDDGRLYPMSFQATSVLDALRFEAELLGIEILCETKIVTVKKQGDGFILNDEFTSDAVIVAGGGKSAPVQGSDGSCFDILSSFGVRMKPAFPSLTGIMFKKKNKDLKGTRAAGEILIVDNGKVVAASSGELQYTDYGISGIPAMEVSRAVSGHFAKKAQGKVVAAINALPDFTPEEIYDYILKRKQHNRDLLCEDLLSGVMPKKLGIAKLHSAGIDIHSPVSALNKNKIALLTEIINSEIFEVSGTLNFENSQVTAGGADTKMFDMNTLECKKAKGLYACGEVLDVDARCGGYNLTWAWSSGRCAGACAVKSFGV